MTELGHRTRQAATDSESQRNTPTSMRCTRRRIQRVGRDACLTSGAGVGVELREQTWSGFADLVDRDRHVGDHRDTISGDFNEAFATAVGLVLYAARHRGPATAATGGGALTRVMGRLKTVFKEFF